MLVFCQKLPNLYLIQILVPPSFHKGNCEFQPWKLSVPLMERRVRGLLILWWGRKKYFEVRKGQRLITPEMQQDIEDACHHHGWQGPIKYDGEEESWLW